MTSHWPPTPQVGGPLTPQIPDGPVSTEVEGRDYHWGPDPGHGGLTKHHGDRESCPGPDCGPDLDGPITPADMAEVTRYATETRQSAHDGSGPPVCEPCTEDCGACQVAYQQLVQDAQRIRNVKIRKIRQAVREGGTDE